MKKRIIFNENGISTSVYNDGSVTDNDPDVPESGTGLYKKVGDVISPLTQEEFDAEFLDYKERREKEYPPTGDQLDEIWGLLEGLTDLSGSDNLSKIKAVKIKHPKT